MDIKVSIPYRYATNTYHKKKKSKARKVSIPYRYATNSPGAHDICILLKFQSLIGTLQTSQDIQ